MYRGRGPTSDMSPLITLRSWGSSSSDEVLRYRPIQVRRGSLACFGDGPKGSASMRMVRNLRRMKGRMFLPARCWRKITLPGEVRRINNAVNAAITSSNGPEAKTMAISKRRLMTCDNLVMCLFCRTDGPDSRLKRDGAVLNRGERWSVVAACAAGTRGPPNWIGFVACGSKLIMGLDGFGSGELFLYGMARAVNLQSHIADILYITDITGVTAVLRCFWAAESLVIWQRRWYAEKDR